MAKSRTNKGREAKVAEYKKQVKNRKVKSMEVPQFRPFRQVPHADPDTKLSITWEQFSVLKDFFNVFAEPINVMQEVFSNGLNEGTISVKYVDNDNKEVPKEEVQAYMQEVKTYLEKQAKETSEDAVVVTDTAYGETVVTEVEPTEVEATTQAAPEKRKLKIVTD